MAKDKPATEIELEELQELYLKDRDNKEVRDKYFILLKNQNIYIKPSIIFVLILAQSSRDFI